MNRAQVAIAVEAARHAIKQSQPLAKLPGSVTSVTGSTATVLIDGTTTAIQVRALVTVTGSQRVMVEFRPSGAAYVVATIT